MITSFESLAERRLMTLNYHKKVVNSTSIAWITLNMLEYTSRKMAFLKITDEFIKVASEKVKSWLVW